MQTRIRLNAVVVCDMCGSSSHGADDEVPLGWATSVERDRVKVFCPACSRDNIRTIESKLDSEWW